MARNVSGSASARGVGLKRVYGYPRNGVGSLDVAQEKAKDVMEYDQVRHEGMAAFEEMENYNHDPWCQHRRRDVCRRSATASRLPTRPINTDCGFPASPIPGATSLINHSLAFMTQALEAVDTKDVWRQNDDTCHLNGSATMGNDPLTSVVNADCRSWDIRNLWVYDDSVFTTVSGVTPSLTVQAIACRINGRPRRALAAQ